MPEKKCTKAVCPIGLVPDYAKYLYYLKGNDVYRVKRKKAGTRKSAPQKIMSNAVSRRAGFLYFLKKASNGKLAIHRRKLKRR